MSEKRGTDPRGNAPVDDSIHGKKGKWKTGESVGRSFPMEGELDRFI